MSGSWVNIQAWQGSFRVGLVFLGIAILDKHGFGWISWIRIAYFFYTKLNESID
jgi:hypothetical protein